MRPQKKAWMFTKICPKCKNSFTCQEYCREEGAVEINKYELYCESCTKKEIERQEKEKKDPQI